MNGFRSALWAEALKIRRSKVPFFTALGFSTGPLAGGLFMIILKDPEAARTMGLISTKAQLTAGSADWPAFLGFLAQTVAAGGAVLFAIITIWIFGREFSDRTAKELLALPTTREAIVGAKFVVAAAWSILLAVYILFFGLLIGSLVDIPGWSLELLQTAFVDIFGSCMLTILLMPFVALLASAGRGYLPPFGWTIFTLVLANLAAVMGWGGWFPWAIPVLFSGAGGPREELLGLHSYIVLSFTSLLGLSMTFFWWRYADQTR